MSVAKRPPTPTLPHKGGENSFSPPSPHKGNSFASPSPGGSGQGEGEPRIQALLQIATEKLSLVSESARLDAELLLAHVLQRPRTWLLSHGETTADEAALAKFRGLVARRSMAEPVAYLTGLREFWSLELEVTSAVLIPRPETETLVEAALARISKKRPVHLADLGTGSGAIALAVARERPACAVIATDSSPAALAVAQRNARRHQLENVEFRHGRWFEPLAGERFELILSNPPYVAADDPHLADLAYEPRRALIAGGNGLAELHLLTEQAPLYLNPRGWLLLEHGATQGEAVRMLLDRAGFTGIETLTDLAGLPRVSFGQLGLESSD